jgi:CRISPR-associated endonuclease/helicase Cas3
MPDGKPLSELIARSENEQGEKQYLEGHLRGVAEKAAGFAEALDAAEVARWLGWWHDAGKVHRDFQDYIAAPDEQPRGPDHSSVGMLHAWEHDTLPFLALNIAGHHGGLPNQQDLKRRVGEKKTTDRILDALELARELILPKAASVSAVDMPRFLHDDSLEEDQRKRRLEFWIRMLHAALTDADCLDSEAHRDPEKMARRRVEVGLAELRRRFQSDQKQKMETSPDSRLNNVRDRIYRQCIDAAGEEPGIFSAMIPTGGGKTRSLMGFALEHAHEHNRRADDDQPAFERVIVVLPYTTIIDQNADEYRDIFEGASEAGQVVLEHHSAVNAGGEGEKTGDESKAEQWRRLVAENWDVPVVVTTTVQFFESLFARRNSRLRKLHNIAGSVVILDEVQTLPPHLLHPTLEVLQELVDNYHTTLVLSTATQPAFAERENFEGLRDVHPIIPEPEKLYDDLKRVCYDVRLDEKWSWADVAAEVRQREQAMVVLNTIADAEAVLDELESEEDVFHLSSKMCRAHRDEVLGEIRERLDPEDDDREPQPVRLVATQVVECGVDIDFPTALRAAGPLDRIIQAAGRCNRENKLPDDGRVIVFDPAEGKCPPGAYEMGTRLTARLLREGAIDLHHPQAPLNYFEKLYARSNPDKKDVQEPRVHLEYETVAERYELIDEASVSYVVIYPPKADEIKRRIDTIQYRGYATRADWRWLQPYIVTLHVWKHEEAEKERLSKPLLDEEEATQNLFVWPEDHYDYDGGTGLQWPTVESLIV